MIVSKSNNTSISWVLNRDELHVLSVIDICASLLSVIGAGSIILSVVIRKKVCKPDVIPIFHLSLADLLASLSLLIDCVLFQYSLDYGVWEVCNIISSLTSACYVITFFLTLTYAIEVYLRMNQRLQGYRYQPNICYTALRYGLYILSWGIPIVISSVMSVILAVDTKKNARGFSPVIPTEIDCSKCLPVFHYNEDICVHGWGATPRLHIVVKYLFLIPLVLVILVNFILYFMTYRRYSQLQNSRGILGYTHSVEGERLRNKAIQFQVVFFGCWIPSLVLGFLSLSTEFNMRTYYPLFIIQSLTSPLQGFFNCVIYGWYRQSFTQALMADENTRLLNGAESSVESGNYAEL